MLVYFLGGEDCRPQFDRARVLKKNSAYLFYTKIGEFIRAVREVLPHIIFVDFNFMNDEYFSLREFFLEKRIDVPLLYFNNPKTDKNSRAGFWMVQMLPHIKDGSEAEYREILESVSCAVDGCEEAEPKTEIKNESKLCTAEDFLYRFRKKYSLSPKLFFLLQCLSSCENGMEKKTLLGAFRNAGMKMTEGALSVCVSRLRRFIAKEDGIDLLREGNGYRLVFFE